MMRKKSQVKSDALTSVSTTEGMHNFSVPLTKNSYVIGGAAFGLRH